MVTTISRHLSSPVDRRRICFPVGDSLSIGVSLVTGLLFDPENRMDKGIILKIFIFIIFLKFYFCCIYEGLIDLHVFIYYH